MSDKPKQERAVANVCFTETRSEFASCAVEAALLGEHECQRLVSRGVLDLSVIESSEAE